VTLPPRNPGRKRSGRCAIFGIGCEEEFETDSADNPDQSIRKRDDKPGCLSDEPGADCLNNDMSGEAKSQDWLKKGGKNPGK